MVIVIQDDPFNLDFSGDDVIGVQGSFPVDLQGENQIRNWLESYCRRSAKPLNKCRGLVVVGFDEFFERLALEETSSILRKRLTTLARMVGFDDDHQEWDGWYRQLLLHIRGLMAKCHPDRCDAWYAGDAFRVLSVIRDRVIVIKENRERATWFSRNR